MKRYPTFLLALLFPITMYGQQNLTADELFLKARTTAFEQKDYTASIALAKEALEKAPNYTDISVFWADYIRGIKIWLPQELYLKILEKERFGMKIISWPMPHWNIGTTRIQKLLKLLIKDFPIILNLKHYCC